MNPLECQYACQALSMQLQRNAFHIGIATGVILASLAWSLALLFHKRKKV